MQWWIDIEDASGNRFGNAPITSAINWQSTRRLDAAGTFSFVMPASDRQAALLRHKRIAHCWSSDENGVVDRGAGIIDHIGTLPNTEGPTMLEVSGDDLLRELVYRNVGELHLYDDVTHDATYVASDVTLSLPANVDLEPGPANALVIGYTETFARIDLTLTSPYNSAAASVKTQYYNSVSNEWVSLAGVQNTTIVDGKPFAQSGYISFETPAGWGKLDGRYLIRVWCEDVNLTTFRLTAVRVHEILPTSDALQIVMALAPPGWTLDAAGLFATEADVYLPISGGSALAALVRLAAQTGEHFRLGASARRVHWLGSAQDASGLRALAVAEASAGTMPLLSLQQVSESSEMFNRLYVYGGGAGDGRLTLADTTRIAPAGFSLSATDSYIEDLGAQSEYGRIDSAETFSDITPIDISQSARVNAANSLFDRGFEILRRKSQLQVAYDLAVVPGAYRVYPGQTVRVTYDEWMEEYHAVHIDDDLVVLETVEQFDETGINTVRLTVAVVDYWPENDYRAVARSLGDIQTERSVKLPQTGLDSASIGIPTFLAIQAGAVVAINKVVPVPDGVYSPVDILVFQGGVVTAVNP